MARRTTGRSLADGTIDVLFEVWSEGREEEIDPWVESLAVTSLGVLGVLGRNGWFLSSFAMDDYEPYASYRGFKRLVSFFFFFFIFFPFPFPFPFQTSKHFSLVATV